VTAVATEATVKFPNVPPNVEKETLLGAGGFTGNPFIIRANPIDPAKGIIIFTQSL
jgi:hypothetical protein